MNKILILCLCLGVYALNITPAFSQEPKSAPQSRISLDIKGMDIVDVLKMLSSRSGMNIIVGKNVTGRVTVFLKDVNVEDAFEIILLSNELAYERSGDIINVMTQRDYELNYGERYQDKKQARTISLKYAKAVDLSRALNQIKTNIGRVVADEGSNTLTLIDSPLKLGEMENFIKKADLPLETKVFNLNYAQADKLQAKIQEAVTKGVGSVKIDERTNKIAVTDYAERLSEIGKLISAFDERTPQVLIDAQIIEIKPSKKFEMGVDWDYWLKKNLRLAASLPTANAVNKLSIGMSAAAKAVGEEGEYKGIIDLLKTIGDTKILSSPRIMALNNQEARILVGTKQPYASQTTVTGEGGTVTTSETVNFVDVGIKLHVTPTINMDKFVTMKIRPEVSSAAEKYTTAKGEQIPIVSTSEAETSVMIKDGVTIVIGGLKKDEKSKTVKKIPFLGDIPVLGNLFKNISDETRTTELVILLTPHILSGSISYTEFSELRPKSGAVVEFTDSGDIKLNKVVSLPQTDLLRLSDSQYYEVVLDKIQTLAFLERPEVERGEVELSFVLSEEGALVDEPEIVKINNPALAAFAVKAIKGASPFPAFPEFLKKEEEKFYIRLSYE